MKSLKLFCLAILTAVAFTGCASSGSSSFLPVEPADYSFTMYDSKGAVLIKGTMTVKDLTLVDKETGRLNGTYTITDSYGDFAGKSSMNGEFSGDYDYSKGKIFMNTNPRIADANVFFSLTMYSSFYEGTWQYSTFRGPTDNGRLKLVPKK